MNRRARILHRLKAHGLVFTVLLVGVWLVSTWRAVYLASSSGYIFGASHGDATVWYMPPNTPGALPPGVYMDGQWPWGYTDISLLLLTTWHDSFSIWPIALITLSLTLAARRLELVDQRRAQRTLCPKCGYDRAGLGAEAVCPECGTITVG